MEKLDDSNFMLYAAKFYDNPSCTDILEFHDDLNRIKYIKRLFKRYRDTGELKERLILNHLIVLYNVFYYQAVTRMLVFKLPNYLEYLKPFLMTLSFWPEKIDSIGEYDEIIYDSDVGIDQEIVTKLRKLLNARN
jgi:hypothetical protein